MVNVWFDMTLASVAKMGKPAITGWSRTSSMPQFFVTKWCQDTSLWSQAVSSIMDITSFKNEWLCPHMRHFRQGMGWI